MESALSGAKDDCRESRTAFGVSLSLVLTGWFHLRRFAG
jgi:hypothetical protein